MPTEYFPVIRGIFTHCLKNNSFQAIPNKLKKNKHKILPVSCQKTEHCTGHFRKWMPWWSPYKVVAEIYSIKCPCVLSPRSRATEEERIPRSRFKNVNADSHSAIILVTEDGSADSDPTDTAACESRRFLKFHRNCKGTKQFRNVYSREFIFHNHRSQSTTAEK